MLNLMPSHFNSLPIFDQPFLILGSLHCLMQVLRKNWTVFLATFPLVPCIRALSRRFLDTKRRVLRLVYSCLHLEYVLH